MIWMGMRRWRGLRGCWGGFEEVMVGWWGGNRGRFGVVVRDLGVVCFGLFFKGLDGLIPHEEDFENTD